MATQLSLFANPGPGPQEITERTRVLTVGYGNRSVDAIWNLVSAAGADLLVDIRRRPFSGAPGWSKPDLKRKLGDRYMHLASLGNAADATGDGWTPIDRDAAEVGIAVLREVIDGGATIALLCGEMDWTGCHRRWVAPAVAGDEWEVAHL